MPQDGDHITLMDLEVDILQHRRQVFVVAKMDVLKVYQHFRMLAFRLNSRLESRHRLAGSALHHHLCWQLDARVIYHLHQSGSIAIIGDLAFVHVDHMFRLDGEHVFHAVLHDHHRKPLIRQLAEDTQRFMCRGGVQAGKRLIQQQDLGAHDQHPGQRQLLLLPA